MCTFGGYSAAAITVVWYGSGFDEEYKSPSQLGHIGILSHWSFIKGKRASSWACFASGALHATPIGLV
eukprot:scaffold26671_cov103-Amphora_coffeaeformis.AAC.1